VCGCGCVCLGLHPPAPWLAAYMHHSYASLQVCVGVCVGGCVCARMFVYACLHVKAHVCINVRELECQRTRVHRLIALLLENLRVCACVSACVCVRLCGLRGRHACLQPACVYACVCVCVCVCACACAQRYAI